MASSTWRRRRGRRGARPGTSPSSLRSESVDPRYDAAGTSRRMLSTTTRFGPDPPAAPQARDHQRAAPRAAAYTPLQRTLRARQPRLIVTPAILAVIIGIFAFPSPLMVRWGAQFGPAIADGEWWRLASAMWLHANPLHLGLNALFLW